MVRFLCNAFMFTISVLFADSFGSTSATAEYRRRTKESLSTWGMWVDAVLIAIVAAAVWALAGSVGHRRRCDDDQDATRIGPAWESNQIR
jgi:hypothetical protein